MSGEPVRNSYLNIEDVRVNWVHPLLTEEQQRTFRSVELQVHEEVARAFTRYTEEERRDLQKSILYGLSHPRIVGGEPKIKKHRLGTKV